MTKVSIIVPVYKVEKYVGQCLQSIFDSDADESRYEVIVVNDGTPDRSMDVVREVCAGHGNVKIIEQENQGLSAARMAGLAQAQGEYVWFVDSDDWLEHEGIGRILLVIEKNPGFSVYAMPLKWTGIGEDRYDYQIEADIPFVGKELLKANYPLWAIQRYIIRRTDCHKRGVYFPIGLLHEDEYYYRVLLYYAPKVLLMASSVYFYRQRCDSIMGSMSVRSYYDCVSIYRHLDLFLRTEVEEADYESFQHDIVGFLRYKYKKSLNLTDVWAGRIFRFRKSICILSQCLKCKAYSLKEKAWLAFMFFWDLKRI